MRNYIKLYETELQLRNYAERTIACYLSMLKLFCEHFETDPVFITETQIKAYLKGSSSQAQLRQRIGALKRFYQYVLKQPLKFKFIDYPRREEHLPDVLSKSEVRRLFAACTNMKHRAIMQIFYSTGIRESELINLKLTDIDSDRMVIRIEQGKGKKDRYVPLSEMTLKVLRKYYREYKPSRYLFNGQFSDRYSATSIRNFVKKYAAQAKINKRVYPHLIRHCNATHLFEAGTDLAVIQRLLGHKQHKTTARYAHMSKRMISTVQTPDSFL